MIPDVVIWDIIEALLLNKAVFFHKSWYPSIRRHIVIIQQKITRIIIVVENENLGHRAPSVLGGGANCRECVLLKEHLNELILQICSCS